MQMCRTKKGLGTDLDKSEYSIWFQHKVRALVGKGRKQSWRDRRGPDCACQADEFRFNLVENKTNNKKGSLRIFKLWSDIIGFAFLLANYKDKKNMVEYGEGKLWKGRCLLPVRWVLLAEGNKVTRSETQTQDWRGMLREGEGENHSQSSITCMRFFRKRGN